MKENKFRCSGSSRNCRTPSTYSLRVKNRSITNFMPKKHFDINLIYPLQNSYNQNIYVGSKGFSKK